MSKLRHLCFQAFVNSLQMYLSVCIAVQVTLPVCIVKKQAVSRGRFSSPGLGHRNMLLKPCSQQTVGECEERK